MAKATTHFVCQECGASHAKWQGQCDSCGAWNTLVEEAKVDLKSASSVRKAVVPQNTLVSFGSLKGDGQVSRSSTNIEEFDRVLGGGIVPGAVMLIGGEPGIGKSTLLTQLVLALLQKKTVAAQNETKQKKTQKPKSLFYISGEENPNQIKLRINSLLKNENKNTVADSERIREEVLGEGLQFVTTTNVEVIEELITEHKPSLVIVDSIQTVTSAQLTGAAGSVGQLREVTDRLTQLAKAYHIPFFLVGHVTKEGTIAGPKVLEHIVDTVLELTGERTGQLRLLRAIKNRFGATDEVGVFKIEEGGLIEVSNPSELFLEHSEKPVPGSATGCVMEGTRPILVEIQSLVVSSQLAMPRRVGRGIELSRIQVLAAVLQKHCRLPLGSHDIFVNVAGGFTVREPAIDLGLVVAIASSLKNKPLPEKSIFIGEVGLLGEIRQVNYLDKRHKEAKRLGYKHVYSRQSHRSIVTLLKELNLV